MIILINGSLAESLVNFRAALIATLQSMGHEVHVSAPDMFPGSYVRTQLEARGVIVHSVPMLRTGISPVADMKTLFSMLQLMRSIRPEAVLGYTVKPVIYGSLAAWFARVPKRFALITGLGYAFQGEGKRSCLQVMVRWLYCLALSRVQMVFFQNPDDLALFRQRGILSGRTPTCVVNGSGVDIDDFSAQAVPDGPIRFLLIARLLGDKGVREYAQAARILRDRHKMVQCELVGWIDTNPDAIDPTELEAWVADGSLVFLGRMSDVRPVIKACSVYVLPSYREGTPRTVLEAMAMGRPIITTDAPGCRETVVNGENGFLVPVKSAEALVEAMQLFIDSPELISSMGAKARQIAEEKYDVHKVNAVMLNAMGIY